MARDRLFPLGRAVVVLAWFAEALLEAAGAWLFWRRRISVLWIWLGFRALSDLFCFSILKISGYQAYVWADHIQRTIQYALFAAACVYSAGQILRELPKTREFYAKGVCIVIVLAISRVNAVWPMSMAIFYGFEIWAEMILAALVAFALGMANGRALRPWGLIGCALVTMGGSDGLITLLRQYGWRAEGWYPLGAITALGMLAWAGWREWRLDKKWQRRAAKNEMEFVERAEYGTLDLGKKMEPSSVLYHFNQAKEM